MESIHSQELYFEKSKNFFHFKSYSPGEVTKLLNTVPLWVVSVAIGHVHQSKHLSI